MSTSTKINVGNGKIEFIDPASTWTKDDFPNLPSSALDVTFSGDLVNRNFSSLFLTNKIDYQSHEYSTIQSSLIKTMTIDNNGAVVIQEPPMNVASTTTVFYPVSSFAPSTIGGANIIDATKDPINPDQLTVAMAKLDGWIAGAFLQQPPLVTITSSLATNIFGGVRWTNPRRYAIMDREIPYVSGVNILIGNGTNQSLNFRITNSNFFPTLNYTDGIVSTGSVRPINEFRVYSASFPISADIQYTKAQMSTNGFQVISESGNLALSGSGVVLNLTSTNGVSTYTTLSLYLPNITNTYPLGSSINFQIRLENNTLDGFNTLTSTITEVGAGVPSAPLNISSTGAATTTTANFAITRPVYSDQVNLDTSAGNFSTYRTRYQLASMVNKHNTGVGFRYGVQSVSTLTQTPYLAYVGSTYIQNNSYTTTPQTISLIGDGVNPLYPALVFSTFTRMTNVFSLEGDQSSTILLSTIFHTDSASAISAASLSNTTSTLTRYSPNNSGVKTVSYGTGWTIGASPANDVFYVSSLQQMNVQTTINSQFNDASYPGDRDNIIYAIVYSNAGVATPTGLSTIISSFNNNFILTTYSSVNSGFSLSTIVSDVFTGVTGQDLFYYQGSNRGSVFTPEINTNNDTSNTIWITQSNRTIPSYSGTITSTITSSLKYAFLIQPFLSSVGTPGITYNNSVSPVVQVSGLYTPDCNASFLYDYTTSNIGCRYVGSNFGQGFLTINGTSAGSVSTYNSNVRVYNDGTNTEITTLPFASNTLLRISSAVVNINGTQYTVPSGNNPLRIHTTAVGYNPNGPTTASSSNLLQIGGSNMFVDTMSAAGMRNFSNISSLTNSQRIISYLPVAGSVLSNINDDVNISGNYGTGLSTNFGSLISVDSNGTAFLSSILYYNHASSLSTVYTDYYSRELMLTSNRYVHPCGYNFSGYNTSLLGVSGSYPDFSTIADLSWDSNYGYRYATFAFVSTFNQTPLQFMYVNVGAPNIVSSITNSRASNNWWPNGIVADANQQYLKVRMHARWYYSFTSGVNQSNSSQWVNALKPVPLIGYDDTVYDMGGGVTVSTLGGGSVQYKIQFGSKNYNKIIGLVRIGIGRDASASNATPITFSSISVSFANT